MKNIELYCGDCLEIMKNIPDKSINLVFLLIQFCNSTICKKSL